MKNTRFMERLFSATEERDEELTSQVAQDIEDAKANGEVDTEEINYKSNGDGTVSITDKENGEVTVAEQGEDGGYELFPAEVTEQIEGFLHPEGDGVTPGQQEGAPDEHVEDHPALEEGVAASQPDTRMAEVEAQEGPCGEECEEEEVREFSVSTTNSVVHRIFNDQAFCERIFSEVIESEETAKVGDLKIEKVPEEDAVIVTSLETGDQARVDLSEEDMDVTELDSKNFSDCECEEGIAEEVCLGEEQNNPLHVVGIDSFNHQIIDAPEYDEESAQELVEALQEQGVDGVQVFDCPDAARDYAIELLNGLDVEEEDIEEPVQAEFSDHTIYVTRFYSEHNNYFMTRLFSESVCGEGCSEDAIEDAIENGDEIETDTEIITPIDATSAVVEDKVKGEYTKAILNGEDLELKHISEEEADELMDGLEVEAEGEDEEEEKDFSDIWCNEAETRFFSEHETITAYMERLFSEEADQDEIEDAIESGEQIENDTEVITPVDATTAIIEDKETGEFTKAVIADDDHMNVEAISEEEADELTDGLAVEDDEEVEESEDNKEEEDTEKDEEEKEEKHFSDQLERFFSEISAGEPADDPIARGEAMIAEGQRIIEEAKAAQEAAAQGEAPKASVEEIEDKAQTAINAIQEMLTATQQGIEEAKAAPVETENNDLREAQFSDSEKLNNTALNWLSSVTRK